jgi:hypothetical protein
MAYGIRRGRPHRANGEVAYHVLEIMHGFLLASRRGRRVRLTGACRRPDPMPEGRDEARLAG